jgi:hypothetical protein
MDAIDRLTSNRHQLARRRPRVLTWIAPAGGLCSPLPLSSVLNKRELTKRYNCRNGRGRFAILSKAVGRIAGSTWRPRANILLGVDENVVHIQDVG